MKYFGKYIVIFCTLLGISALSQTRYEQDFLELWNDYNDNYAYFEKQHIDWAKVKDIYQPQAAAIKDDAQFITFLEQVLQEFHNGHVSLTTNLPSSNRIIPSGNDLFAEKRGNYYFIADVKPQSGAEACGLKPGMQLLKFNGKAVGEELKRFLPKYITSYNESMYSYALNMLMAGTHDTQREITLIENGIEKIYYPDAHKPVRPEKLLDYKLLPGNIGYIKINNSLGNTDVIAEFDKALDDLIKTKSIILNLTDTPGGGNTTVARGIMGRFTCSPLPYQKHVINEKQYGTVRSWVEFVSPRKTNYTGKLVVMAGHWTGSMGEGMVIGFDAMRRAKITGTKMAGLLGAIYTYRMKNTNIGYQIPIEGMYHVNDTPREDFMPKYITANSSETFAKALSLAR
ncbi:S41 family peptidase [Flavobacterium sp. J372]|uniref:S41 family peptidase n=2 Tax=Flavobacterium sp. J372 TaxID=2898436 RepID=UPI0021506D10|nr:S41 family peptidase [Flavobacterium sp. J372]MCR5862656.1 S41 family peptidase [Flavobacterium sp. J372]